jgi:3-oxoacyl-[acyl-carrier protein] reductase
VGFVLGPAPRRVTIAAAIPAPQVSDNAIAPALIEQTRMRPGDPVDLAGRIPVGRLGTPAQAADLGLAILRHGYVSDQVISIDGGMQPR